ncbi:hypothetical protein DPMN_041499 [Dreissena polymorpha]|uniref:Uncharacterized protein n=1 Tax=Dreissena polymorpha TaxID=45954 RepID=A0A9D4HW53_DREPO|nr:hypothetical protein DPMN_041499 [Dreissena polymorpha]
MLPWLMVYDHTNYARWGPVYQADIKASEYSAPEVFKVFIEGHFVVRLKENESTEYLSIKILSV